MLGSYWTNKYDSNSLTDREIKNLSNYNWYQEIENKDFLFIRNVGGQWLLYTEHMNKGYTRSETIIIKRKDGTEKVVPATKWTQKGRLKIHQTLTELGILANVDKEKKFS